MYSSRFVAVQHRERHVGALAVVSLLLALIGVALPAASAGATASCTPSAGFNQCAWYAATGADQTFTVPVGVKSVNLRLWGGAGGSTPKVFADGTNSGAGGAGGGFTSGTLAVSPGQVLTLKVGEGGAAGGTGGDAAYGGGGAPGTYGGGGGGYSGVFTSAGDPLLIAGGGGGASGTRFISGAGGGGGLAGGTGQSSDGVGGTQSGGGAVGGAFASHCTPNPTPGAAYQGGSGGQAAGAGGGGYFGGGGGLCTWVGSGNPPYSAANGGGGSGFVGGTGVTGAVSVAGSNGHQSNGAAPAGASDDQYVAGVGQGYTWTNAIDGGDGMIVVQYAYPHTVITTPEPTAAIGKQVTLKGTGNPGATLTITAQGSATPLCTTTTGTDGSWTCAVTLVDGANTVVATEKLAADPGATLVTDTWSATVDATAPPAPAVTSPSKDSVQGDAEVSPAGTGEAGSTVTVTNGEEVVCTTTVTAAGTWACPAVDLSDGEHTLSVTATDPLGNESVATTVTVTIDTKAPAAPVVSAPSEGSAVASTTPTLSGTGEPGSTVTIKDGGGEVIGNATVDESGTWSATVEEVAAGDQTVTVTVTDPAGNVSPGTEVSFTVDTTVPTTPVITDPISGYLTDDPIVPITGTGEAGSVVTVFDGSPAAPDGSPATRAAATEGTALCQATVAAAGTWTCTPDPLADGVYALTPRAADAAGNRATGLAVTATVDTTAPEAPVVTYPGDGSEINDTTPTLTGTGEPGGSITVTEGGTELCTATVAEDGTWSCTTPALGEGEHEILVAITDAAGNGSDETTTVIVDVTPPTAPTIDPGIDGSTVDTTTPTITGGGEGGSTTTITDGGEKVCETGVETGGTWSCTTDQIDEGEHELTITATDNAGNGSEGVDISITVDVAPAPATDVQCLARNETVTCTGRAQVGADVAVTNAAGKVVIASAAGRDGVWSGSGRGEVGDVFTVTVTDSGGTSEGLRVRVLDGRELASTGIGGGPAMLSTALLVLGLATLATRRLRRSLS